DYYCYSTDGSGNHNWVF
nr:immunoglobulin light chain junction region [Macaca mulatta]MOX33510.1 immunoglobulin light chain junction region [Macaca mulatta]MOX35165.1 immunoglobulin light chain junction region [Macaca mulatta]MOX35266.1 immunoglobulin light chain junction region [Macaca mulatta]MOX36506.1 immunoglobulin light chain junction region [Macaca mulatta]